MVALNVCGSENNRRFNIRYDGYSLPVESRAVWASNIETAAETVGFSSCQSDFPWIPSIRLTHYSERFDKFSQGIDHFDTQLKPGRGRITKFQDGNSERHIGFRGTDESWGTGCLDPQPIF
jgi:hypothetical protein